ncbi:hypothetical protein [Planctopirus hydrillae]|nr:hypothetical protein [Planctopirus hydrillae]
MQIKVFEAQDTSGELYPLLIEELEFLRKICCEQFGYCYAIVNILKDNGKFDPQVIQGALKPEHDGTTTCEKFMAKFPQIRLSVKHKEFANAINVRFPECH